MAIILKETKVTVSSAGTAVDLTSGTPSVSDQEKFVTAIIITAGESNSGTLYIGSSAVDAASGLGQSATAGESVILSPPQQVGIDESMDMSKIFVDSTSNGDVAAVTYFLRENK